jgi:antitoxin (DNA-binding transcriptional repressor) of toxin-antitoxin stability system
MAAKITQVHVYIIGGVLMLIVGLGLYFALMKPLLDENASLTSAVQGLEAQSVSVDGKSFTIAQHDQAQAQLVAAQQRRDKNEARLKSLESKKQLRPGDQIRILESQDELMRVTMARWLQLPRIVVTMMEDHAQKLAKKHNVTVQTAFAAPASVPNPNAIPKDIIAYQLGGMSVRGDFTRVMNWVKDWNNAPLLVSVDGLKCQLAGAKGEVSATCALTAFVFPTGPGAVIPGAGGGGAAPGMDPSMGGMAGSDPGMMYSDQPGAAGGMNGAGGGMNGP